MISSTIFETGIIKNFRLFTGVRFALLIFSCAVYLFTAGGVNALAQWPLMLVDAGLLLAYLSMPSLQALLKRAYLPIGIFWATVGPLLELHLVFLTFTRATPVRSAFLLLLLPILVLFIPLVITSWRYSNRAVFLFCGVTFLFDASLIFFGYQLNGVTYATPLFGLTITRTVLFLFVGNMTGNMMRTQVAQHQRLTKANERLAQYASTLEQLTISRERNRMARELHDVLAHTMSGVAVELEGVRALLRSDPDQAEELLGQSLRAVREGLTETRRALQALRASPVEDLGLGLAVRNLVETIAGRAGLETECEIGSDLGETPADVQQCFYRVAQEALTNVVAHSQASKVQVSLVREGLALNFSIRDDGVGFDENAMDLTEKYGLVGMRERVEMIQGELSIISHVGAGTQIYFSYRGTGAAQARANNG